VTAVSPRLGTSGQTAHLGPSIESDPAHAHAHRHSSQLCPDSGAGGLAGCGAKGSPEEMESSPNSVVPREISPLPSLPPSLLSFFPSFFPSSSLPFFPSHRSHRMRLP